MLGGSYPEVTCGGLNENDPHKHIYLNILFPVSGTVREELEDMALLEEVCHWEWDLRFQKPMPSLESCSLPVACRSGSRVLS